MPRFLFHYLRKIDRNKTIYPALGKLIRLLPRVVDKLTPDGKVPNGDIMSKGMDMLGGLFGKK